MNDFDERVKFITPSEYPLQFGIMNYSKGESAPAHKHPNIQRVITRSQEAIHVIEGKIKLDIFNSEGKHLKSKIIEAGDSAFFVQGGRGWTAVEDTKMIEVKQGPYLGEKDKVLI